VVTSPDSHPADNVDASRAQDNWESSEQSEAGNVAAAGGRTVKCVVIQGRRCRSRLSGVVVTVWCSVWCSRIDGQQTQRGGLNGESRRPGNWSPSGYS
jgi:hypothetical protein